jgi:tRNA pseudouridine32 synthase / 23S rRNA pseudouridine746 synthase
MNTMLHSLAEYGQAELLTHQIAGQDEPISYWYEGRCPQTGNLLRLPRTRLAEAIARGLMQQLAADPGYAREGKMYGVLLVEAAGPGGSQVGVLQAFSGLLNRHEGVGWVPPIAGREKIAAAEAQTLVQLDAIKQTLITLQQIPERQRYELLAQKFSDQLAALDVKHQAQKQQRDQIRQSLDQTTDQRTFSELEQQSRLEGTERRHLKQQRDRVLNPLKQTIEQADDQIQQLKQQRKALSQQLHAQMQAAYHLSNFAGRSISLEQLILGHGLSPGLPTGTGDCCAPKLLHYAATHGYKPLAMAEFWWGSIQDKTDSDKTDSNKVEGRFYGACVERCQPLMGFLLSGLAPAELLIIYEDDWLIGINKPAGLLSVPGRYLDRQDSVVSRLAHHPQIQALHRLDQDTSGASSLNNDRCIKFTKLYWQGHYS